MVIYKNKRQIPDKKKYKKRQNSSYGMHVNQPLHTSF